METGYSQPWWRGVSDGSFRFSEFHSSLFCSSLFFLLDRKGKKRESRKRAIKSRRNLGRQIRNYKRTTCAKESETRHHIMFWANEVVFYSATITSNLLWRQERQWNDENSKRERSAPNSLTSTTNLHTIRQPYIRNHQPPNLCTLRTVNTTLCTKIIIRCFRC